MSQICVFYYYTLFSPRLCSFKECTLQFQLNRTEFIQGFKKYSRCLGINAECIVYCIFTYTSIMIVEHKPVSILLLQILANVCIVFMKLPIVSDILTIHSTGWVGSK